ncbi:MAG TPA: HAD family hydrolase [Gemmatimonadales bacterium]|nr:HAD family hydrolase [Gemmatimonadales bacterium]
MSRIRAGDSPLSTFTQSIGRLPLLLRHMEPTWFMESLAELDASFVQRHDISGLIWDVDGTLTAYHETTLLPSAAEPFEALRAAGGLRHAILSNAPERRFQELSGMFPTIPVLRGYLLEGEVRGRRLLGGLDSWAPGELDARMAAGAVVLRKPDPRLVDLAVAELGGDHAGIVMVGDQHLTDVAGASLAGVRSIKLRNPARPSFPREIRLTQRLEAMAYRVLGRRR